MEIALSMNSIEKTLLSWRNLPDHINEAFCGMTVIDFLDEPNLEEICELLEPMHTSLYQQRDMFYHYQLIGAAERLGKLHHLLLDRMKSQCE